MWLSVAPASLGGNYPLDVVLEFVRLAAGGRSVPLCG
jgi:hypothetical protein